MPDRKRPGHNAVKEGFDKLPQGICFFEKEGLPILCNLQMYRLSRFLLGSNLQYLGEVEKALLSPPADIHPVESAENTFRFPDGSVWQFDKRAVLDKSGTSYIRLTADDVTQLHQALLLLEEDNRMLAEDAKLLRELAENAEALATQKERLAAKSALHDNLAACITVTKRFLSGDMPNITEEQVVQEWEKSMAFREMGKVSAKERLLSQAEKSDVTVCLVGMELPEEAAEFLYSAALVALNNAVQYAKATELYVTVTQSDAYYTAMIRNNGIQPTTEIVEGGGLSNLRRRTERAGGYMTVQSLPEFMLLIGIPKSKLFGGE